MLLCGNVRKGPVKSEMSVVHTQDLAFEHTISTAKWRRINENGDELNCKLLLKNANSRKYYFFSFINPAALLRDGNCADDEPNFFLVIPD